MSQKNETQQEYLDRLKKMAQERIARSPQAASNELTGDNSGPSVASPGAGKSRSAVKDAESLIDEDDHWAQAARARLAALFAIDDMPSLKKLPDNLSTPQHPRRSKETR